MPQSPAPSQRESSAPVGAGALAYGKAIAQAGGNEIECLASQADDDAVYVALYDSPAYDLKVSPLEVSRLSVHLTPAVATGALDSDRLVTYRAPRHSVYLTPAHAPSQWSKDRPSRHVNIYFKSAAFGGEGPAAGRLDEAAAACINAALVRVLPGIRDIADSLAAELSDPNPLSVEAVDCLARLMLVQVARAQLQLQKARSPITPVMLKLIQDFVQANLAEQILVGQMAAVVGMSVNRFAHAYTTQTGQSPHQFVLTQRLELAASLLARTRMPLAEIAVACGFASQQHLTNTMRAKTGTTPARYRSDASRQSVVAG
jgi:AraC family transcriptional regulator